MQSRDLLQELKTSYSSFLLRNGSELKVDWSIEMMGYRSAVGRFEAPAKQSEMWKMVNAIIETMRAEKAFQGTNTVTNGNKHFIDLLLRPKALMHIGVYVPPTPPAPKTSRSGMFGEPEVAQKPEELEVANKSSSGCVIL